MKTIFWTFVAVLGGIFIYVKLTAKTKEKTTPVDPVTGLPAYTGDGTFYGPDVDQLTGAYLPMNARPGTVTFPVQPIN